MIKKKICFVAGKSAGHILPALTLAQQYKRQNPNMQIIFYSNHTALDLKLLKTKPEIDQYFPLSLMSVPFKQPWRLLKFVWQLLCATIHGWRVLRDNQVSEVISIGGLISIPICLAGWVLKIPITLYEPNVNPGKASKLISKWATHIKVCFKETTTKLPTDRCSLVSYPIRFESSEYQTPRSTVFKELKVISPNLDSGRYTILVLGGSQGSLFINHLMRTIIPQLPIHQIQIIHQTGVRDQFDWSNFYIQKQIPAIIFSYTDNLMPYYLVADLIICRAGAGTLAEITPLHTPTICIPLQTDYTDHQVANAIAIAKIYPYIQVKLQKELSQQTNWLVDQIMMAIPKVRSKSFQSDAFNLH